MADTDDDLAAYVIQAAQLMGVNLGAADRAAVVANFRNYRALYEAIRDFDLGDAVDPAGIYRP
jgi:hypothetical protein